MAKAEMPSEHGNSFLTLLSDISERTGKSQNEILRRALTAYKARERRRDFFRNPAPRECGYEIPSTIHEE